MEKNNRKYTIENLEELLDKIPYEMWIKDSEGRHQYINKISAERMGLKKEDVIGKTDYDFRPKEMAESCMEGDRAVLSTGEDVLVEDKIEVSDTEEKWYEIFKTVLNGNGDEKLIGGVARYTSINSLQNATVVFNCRSFSIWPHFHPVSSSSSLFAHTAVSSVTESLDPAGISNVSRSSAERY